MFDEKQLSAIFFSLSDPARRSILRSLIGRPLPVHKLAEECEKSVAVVSKHLIVLERAHLIRKEKIGLRVFVEVNLKQFKLAQVYINEFTKYWDARQAKFVAAMRVLRR